MGCPSGCGGPSAPLVEGQDIYTSRSSICAAAVHSGVISDKSGGDVMLTVSYPQNRYIGERRNGVDSQNSKSGANGIVNGGSTFGNLKSFVVSLPTMAVLARVAERYTPYFAGV